MAEKEQRARLQKMEDDSFAAIVKQQVQEGDRIDDQKKQDTKSRAQAYVGRLRQQMAAGAEKKRYQGLMTEHERRVNDRDIKAYEQMDTVNLYGKLPGFGGGHEADRQR